MSGCVPKEICPITTNTGIIFKGSCSNQTSGGAAVINTSTFDSKGNYYVGGDFLTVNGIYCSGIAKWNGTTWSSIGFGFNNAVNAIAVDVLGNIYAGGSFTSSADGKTALLGVAKFPFNGSSWTSLGYLAQSEYDTAPFVRTTINALLLDDSRNLYIGGDFKYINNSTTIQYSIAVFTPCGSLSSLNGGMISASSGTTTVNALVITRNTLFIGGNFNGISTPTPTISANLIGLNLLTLPYSPIAINTSAASPYGTTSSVSALAIYNMNLYVGTNSGVALYATGNSSLASISLLTATFPITDVKDKNNNYIPLQTAISKTKILNIVSGNCGIAFCGCFTKATGGTSNAISNTDVPLHDYGFYKDSTFYSNCITDCITSIAVDSAQNFYLTYTLGSGSGIIKIINS